MKTIKSLLAVSVLAAAGAANAATIATIDFTDKWQSYGWTSLGSKANFGTKYGVGMASGTSGYLDSATGELKFDGTNGSSLVTWVKYTTTDLLTDPVTGLTSTGTTVPKDYTATWTYAFHGSVDTVNNTYTMTGITQTLIHCEPTIAGNTGACSMGADGTVLTYNFPNSSTGAAPAGVPATVSLNGTTDFARQGKLGGFPVFNVDAWHVTAAPTAPAVPVPAAAWLFGSGLLGLAGTARRRRNA